VEAANRKIPKFGTATQIVVVQYEPQEERRVENNLIEGYGRFKVINRIEIPKGEFTYDIAVKKVIELDQIYNPAFIYPDRGAGEYQIELLRKALGDKVKGVHLGSSHEVRDPVSRIFEKKPIKPFMVNQAVLLLERGMLRIPAAQVDPEIVRQMTNYQVVRIAAKTGEPSYSSTDEHALDAMMLALLAFIIEIPDLAKTIHQISVARNMAKVKVSHYDPMSEISINSRNESRSTRADDWDEPGQRPLKKVPLGYDKKKRTQESISWGSRGSNKNSGFERRSW
jgi:replicative DNA helicase